MTTKPRSDAKLLNLPADQQASLNQWLLDGLPYTTIQKHILDHFAIHCSTMAISRYWHKIVKPLLAAQRAHLLDRAQFLGEARALDPHAIDLLVADRLEQRLLELLADPANLPDNPEKLLDLLLRLRRQKLREEQHALQTELQRKQTEAAIAATEEVDYSRPLTPEQRQALIDKMKDLCGLTPDPGPRIPEAPGEPTWEEVYEQYKDDPQHSGTKVYLNPALLPPSCNPPPSPDTPNAP